MRSEPVPLAICPRPERAECPVTLSGRQAAASGTARQPLGMQAKEAHTQAANFSAENTDVGPTRAFAVNPLELKWVCPGHVLGRKLSRIWQLRKTLAPGERKFTVNAWRSASVKGCTKREGLMASITPNFRFPSGIVH